MGKARFIPVELTTITTTDKVELSGIAVEPKGRKRIALIWLHGIASAFYRGQPLVRELSGRCRAAGIGYFKWNTRGHEVAVPSARGLIGSGFERFTDCLKDIEAMIRLVKRRGYSRIVLAGHSTGANKALYYYFKRRRSPVTGLILAGPASDISGDLQHLGQREFNRRLAIARRAYRRDPHALIVFPGMDVELFTAERYRSLFESGRAEDVFPYHTPRASWKEVRSVRVPMLVVAGERDQYFDRPSAEVMALFQSKATATPSFTGRVIAGADHGFHGREAALAKTIVSWITKTVAA